MAAASSDASIDIAPERRERGAVIFCSNLSRFLLAERELAHHVLPNDEFLHLAGDGHRELVDEAHVARDFVMGDLALAEGSDLLARRALACASA